MIPFGVLIHSEIYCRVYILLEHVVAAASFSRRGAVGILLDGKHTAAAKTAAV